MKLSLRWIAQHIKNFPWPESEQVCLAEIMRPLGSRVAEIEHYTPLTLNQKLLMVGQVVSVGSGGVVVGNFTLPERHDLAVGDTVLLTSDGTRWGTHKDLGGDLETVLPPVTGVEKLSAIFSEQDYIISIDNGAISHRPDLWGHRGWAREIAAILGCSMRPLEELCADIPVVHGTVRYEDPRLSSVAIELKPDTGCDQLAVLWYPECVWQPTHVELLCMLARIGGRGINALVDLTNYTMYDLGYPSHMFDGQKIAGAMLHVRKALPKEQVVLLNNSTVELDVQDTVLADGAGVAALPGIMGAARTGITRTTEQVLCEAAYLQPAVVRATRTRLGLSSEAAIRFEKNLDTAAPVWVLRRIRALMEQYGIRGRCVNAIQVVGHGAPALRIIDISHALIISRMGIETIAVEWITQILTRLGFNVQVTGTSAEPVYAVQVPSWRMRDIHIAEDLIEEIMRHYEYVRIPYKAPAIVTAAHDMQTRMRARQIQDICAWGLGMQEIKNYAFFDESWCAELGWKPTHAVQIKNPVSQNNYRLVTTLIPQLLHAVYSNYRGVDRVRFFESNAVWRRTESMSVQEHTVIAGIIWEHAPKAIDFYAGKLMVEKILYRSGYAALWEPSNGDGSPWWMPGQTAVIVSPNGETVGYAGMLHARYRNLLPGGCFIFELNFDLLSAYRSPVAHCEPLSKYPVTTLDVSVLVPYTSTVKELINSIQAADKRIIDVYLYDRYENSLWKDRYSVTMRYRVTDAAQNLTSEDIAQVRTSVERALSAAGGEIR